MGKGRKSNLEDRERGLVCSRGHSHHMRWLIHMWSPTYYSATSAAPHITFTQHGAPPRIHVKFEGTYGPTVFITAYHEDIDSFMHG